MESRPSEFWEYKPGSRNQRGKTGFPLYFRETDMKKMLVRISPDGKEILHLHNDNIKLGDACEVEIHRATDVYFDNKIQRWKIRDIRTNTVLTPNFLNRWEALAHEQVYLEDQMRGREV